MAIYQSQSTGQEIDERLTMAANAVQFILQTLSDLQKAQARENIEAASAADLADKVDKVQGKGLSTNDYTDQAKALVDALPVAIQSLQDSIAAKYTKPGTGIPKDDLASGVQTSLGNADAAVQDIASINGLIPAAASAQNQLADKAFVNSSVATNTANYISDNGQPFTSVAALEAYSGTLTNNDYAFVVGTDSAGNTTYTRYKYNASTQQWAAEYVLNNSSFTATQWAAIQSGITALLVQKLEGLPDAVEANPTVPAGTTPTDLTGLKVGDSYYGIPALPSVDNTPTANSNNLVKSGGVYSEIHPAVQSSQPQGGFLPNVFYNLGTLSGNTAFAFASATDNTIENEWMFQFTTPSTAPTITWPQAITAWLGGNAPTINASKTYQVSVVNGLGVIAEF